MFKLVPLVNPDGVARGHQRTDTFGQNLNRRYMDPSPEREPTVYAIRQALLDWYDSGRLEVYFDLHAHTSRENAFLFGNFYPDLESQVENITLAKLTTLNSQHMDWTNCNFAESGMSKTMHDGTSKSGSGRVALFHAVTAAAGESLKKKSKRVLCYTIEVHFNKGRHRNPIARATGKGSGRCSPPRPATTSGGRYTTDDWGNIGKHTVISLLDYYGCNPWSRLAGSEFRSLEGVRSWAMQNVLSSQGFRDDQTKVASEALLLSMSGKTKASTSTAKPRRKKSTS